LICEIIFFPKFCGVLFGFYFSIIFVILFQFALSVLVKKFYKFYVFLFYGLKILSKNFGKSWNIFLKNIEI